MDEVDALSEREQRALAAWADDDPPDDFADGVVAAWLREQGTRTESVAAPRSSARDRRPVIGIAAGLAAAAAVLLMVRAMPGVATGAPMTETARHCDRAGEPGGPMASLLEPASPDETSMPSESAGLAADALAVLTHHCMPCHDGTDDEAQVGALQVYDVTRARWWESMSDDQLREAQTRIEQLGSASARERRSMAAFVDAQLRQRARAGSPS